MSRGVLYQLVVVDKWGYAGIWTTQNYVILRMSIYHLRSGLCLPHWCQKGEGAVRGWLAPIIGPLRGRQINRGIYGSLMSWAILDFSLGLQSIQQVAMTWNIYDSEKWPAVYRTRNIFSCTPLAISCSFSSTHWGWDKMDTIYQTTFSNRFSWKRMYEFWLKFHWSLS